MQLTLVSTSEQTTKGNSQCMQPHTIGMNVSLCLYGTLQQQGILQFRMKENSTSALIRGKVQNRHDICTVCFQARLWLHSQYSLLHKKINKTFKTWLKFKQRFFFFFFRKQDSRSPLKVMLYYIHKR